MATPSDQDIERFCRGHNIRIPTSVHVVDENGKSSFTNYVDLAFEKINCYKNHLSFLSYFRKRTSDFCRNE